ncbi:hypothetical protein B0O80DRAFT_527186 [Mortierella sp. GBAus27b]|nr:hypothetical protein B0O80DRAFT_527186 [Mortierella sp. GBAus27b]
MCSSSRSSEALLKLHGSVKDLVSSLVSPVPSSKLPRRVSKREKEKRQTLESEMQDAGNIDTTMGALLGLDTIMLDMTLHTGYAHQVDRPHQPARKVVQDGVQRTWTALAINPTGVIHNQAMSAVIEPDMEAGSLLTGVLAILPDSGGCIEIILIDRDVSVGIDAHGSLRIDSSDDQAGLAASILQQSFPRTNRCHYSILA